MAVSWRVKGTRPRSSTSAVTPKKYIAEVWTAT